MESVAATHSVPQGLFNEQPFWLVYSTDLPPEEYGANCKIPNKQEAVNIATRLAGEHPGARFYVLKSEFAALMPKVSVATRDFISDPVED